MSETQNESTSQVENKEAQLEQAPQSAQSEISTHSSQPEQIPQDQTQKNDQENPKSSDQKEKIDDDLKEKLEQEKKISEASSKLPSKTLTAKCIYLNKLKEDRDEISKLYKKDVDNLFMEFDKKYLDIYDRINKITTCELVPDISQEELDKYEIKNTTDENKKIEDYWEKVIINSKYFTVSDKDKKILKHLKSVYLENVPEKKNDFYINFIFEPNEYFSNEKLSKKYIFDDITEELKSAEGTVINWKSPEMDTTIKTETMKIKKKRKFEIKTITKEEDSFFALFKHIHKLTFLEDEVTFFQDDLFCNQLEYYMDILKVKCFGKDDLDFDEADLEGEEREDDEDDNKEKKNKRRKRSKGGKKMSGEKDGKDDDDDGKECKNQ